MQGVPGDRRRLAPTKTLLLSCEIDLGRQVDVPADCDIVYSISRALFPYSYLRCTLVFWLRFWSMKQGLRFKVCLGFVLFITPTAREPEPLEDPPAYFLLDASAES